MSEKREQKKKRSKLQRRLERFGRGARNAFDILRKGRIGAPYTAPFDVVADEPLYRLRRYGSEQGPSTGESLLLIPPLMVAAEIYDISPELSAVALLAAAHVDLWVIDFGAPEQVEGGMSRTLDDHVVAVDAAIERIREATGRDVHVGGYSQGGIFAYLAVAYRRSEGVASVITFGSPVDIRRNLPVKVHDDLAERLIRGARGMIAGRLSEIDGLPGSLTSRGFKLASPKKEVKQILDLFGLLPDREALARREPKRRFLGGEGFVAWPGPAFRDFVDDVIVDNRMLQGGLVLAGRSVSLADLRCPILYFVGLRDDMARPASVRAIGRAAPHAELHEVPLAAGHFGLVVGTRAVNETWPTVIQWLGWKSGRGDMPALLDASAAPEPEPSAEAAGAHALYDMGTDLVDELWERMGEISLDAAAVVDALRWQIPRLARITSLAPHSRVSVGRALAEQAAAIGDEPFFLWRGRAYTYAEANARVNRVAGALVRAGVERGHHVAVYMGNHPDYLTVAAAVNRLGAVAVLLPTGARGASLEHAIGVGEVDLLVCDGERAEAASRAFVADSIVAVAAVATGAEPAALPDGVRSLEALIDPAAPDRLPEGLLVDDGRADDLAMVIFTSGTTGLPRAARITNRRWTVAAMGAAAACKLSPRDTVYCCLPLHHATGLLLAVGGALVGGARLALAPRFSAGEFWDDVRRYGATVVFYAGELCRYLVATPESPGDGDHPVRLFAGNGLRPATWERMLERFGELRIIEFYGSTEGNAVLANLSGEKVGSVGRPLVGSGDVALIRWDMEAQAPKRDDDGQPEPADDDEAGMLLGRIDGEHPLASFDGYVDAAATERKVLRGLFEPDDAWFVTGDLLRRDADGDYWFVDRVGDTFRFKGENVSAAQVEAVVAAAPQVAVAAVYGVKVPGVVAGAGRAGMAAIQLAPGADFDGEDLFARVEADLTPAARPRFVRLVDRFETTESLKLIKRELRAEGADRERIADPLFAYDEGARSYVPLDTRAGPIE